MSLRARLSNQQGFTIVETMAATLIMAVAFLGLAGVHAVSSGAQSLGNNQGLATFIANEQIEKMRRGSFAEVVTSAEMVDVQGVSFTVARIVENSNLSKRVSVLVVWSERAGVQQLMHETLVSSVTNP